MRPLSPDSQGARLVDYRPTRCRCNAVIQPHSVVCGSCGRRQNLFFAGLDRLYEDDLDKLLKYHQGEVEKKPTDFMRLFQLAGVFLLRGDYETSRDIYRKVTELEPDYADAHLNLGGVLASLDDKDGAVDELQKYVRLDLHSPKVERVIRAICSIRNIPYEDALEETAPKEFSSRSGSDQSKKPGAKISTPGKSVLRGARYIAPPKPVIKKRAWGFIDIFLLLMILICAAGWFLFPAQSRSAVDSVIGIVEDQYLFTVTTSPPEGFIAEDDTGSGAPTTVPGEEIDTEPEIINLDPEIDSYFPLNYGNKWEYYVFDSRHADGSGARTRETTQEMVVDTLVDPEKGLWRLLNGSDYVYYTERRTGIYAGTDSRGLWSSLYVQMPLPADVGKRISTAGQSAEIVGTEVLETAVGKIQCVKVKVTSSAPSDTVFHMWFGRGVGLVKYVGGGRNSVYHVRELKSFELE